MKPPPYIPLNRIATPDLTYKWDDWDPFEPLPWPEEATKATLAHVSNRAITAFALGCAEWVIYRLKSHFKDRVPFWYLDAFWLYLYGRIDTPPPPTNSDDWEGLVLGPSNLALMTVLNTIYLSEDGPPVQNGALAPQIALHVLPTTAPFLEWQEASLGRLTRFCPREADRPDGFPLPRALLDPTIDLAGLDITSQLGSEAREIDVTDNPFLSK
jgi:hypothetical protein